MISQPPAEIPARGRSRSPSARLPRRRETRSSDESGAAGRIARRFAQRFSIAVRHVVECEGPLEGVKALEPGRSMEGKGEVRVGAQVRAARGDGGGGDGRGHGGGTRQRPGELAVEEESLSLRTASPAATYWPRLTDVTWPTTLSRLSGVGIATGRAS